MNSSKRAKRFQLLLGFIFCVIAFFLLVTFMLLVWGLSNMACDPWDCPSRGETQSFVICIYLVCVILCVIFLYGAYFFFIELIKLMRSKKTY